MNRLLVLPAVLFVTLLFSFNVYAYKKPDPIFVGGVQYKIDKTNFLFKQGAYETVVPVVGGSGQKLIFDIDARIGGRGYHDIGAECITLYPQQPGNPNGPVLIGGGGPCHIVTVNPSNEFQFMIEMSAFCSGTPIARDLNDRNTLLRLPEVDRVKKDIKGLVDKGYKPPFLQSSYNTKRTLNLLIDKEIDTNGECAELTIRVKGFKTSIDKMSVDVFVGEAF